MTEKTSIKKCKRWRSNIFDIVSIDTIERVASIIAHRFSSSLSGDYEENFKELKSEIFLKITKVADKYDSALSQPRTFLDRYANRACFDYLRKLRAEKRQIDDEALEDQLMQQSHSRFSNDPETIETIELIWRAVELLPFPSQVAVKDVVKGYSISRAAKRNGIPRSTFLDQCRKMFKRYELDKRIASIDNSVNFRNVSVYEYDERRNDYE